MTYREASRTELFDRFGFLQFLDAFFAQPENLAKHLIVVDADPRRRPRRVGLRQRRNSGQAVMRDLAPGLRLGFDDVAARAQVNVVKQIFAG